MAAATLAITVHAFNVKIESIPVVGLSIRFEDGVFSFLLLISLIYFGITFLIYYVIDIKDFEKPSHLTNTDNAYQQKVEIFKRNSIESMAKKMQDTLPAAHRLILDNGRADALFTLSDEIWPRRPPQQDYLNAPPTQGLVSVVSHKSGKQSGDWIPKENRDIFGPLVAIIDLETKRFGRSAHLYRLFILPWRYGVHTLYLFRLYFIDGILPIAMAVIAMASIYDLVDLTWLSLLVPPAAP